MSAEPEPLLDLATSVADGTDVDWDAVESGVAGSERRIVRHLRLVSNVAALYRSLPQDPQATADVRAGEPAGPRWGHLVLLERLGQGTSAEVHRAWDLDLQREVALKLFARPGPGSDAALEEARRLARIRHPHVAVVFGADRHEGRAGFWMELVRGASLEQTLEEQGPFSAREAAVAGIQICAALAAVHGAGLLHRDIKAQNVLREEGGRIVLTDFGTGEPLASAAARPRMAGTPMYLAPEIFAGHAASVQSDLYGVGVLLFYLVTRQFPVVARTLPELASAHKSGNRRHLRDLRPDLDISFVEVVERLLSPRPEDRYPTAGALEAALRDTLAGPATTAGRAVPAEQTEPAVGNVWGSTRLLAAAAVLAIAVTALLIWTLSRRHVPQPPATTAVETLAVLPLADLTGGAGPPHLADALTDQLISTIGQLKGLRVTSRTSVLPFAKGGVPLGEIAKRLRVNAVLEGSLAVDEGDGSRPGRVRVNARLLRAGTEARIWSGTFERALGDSLALQSDLARAIAREVNVAISPSESERLGRAQPTSPAAEAAYFEGLHYLNNLGVENARLALQAFERATRLDVNYAAAYVGMSRALLALGDAGAILHPEARARALAAVSRAMELDDRSAEAHTAVGDLRFHYDWNWAGAEQAYERGIALNPSSAPARMEFARFLAAMGRLAEAVQQAALAADVDPLSARTAQVHALMLYYSRDYQQAAAVLDRAESLDPDMAGTHVIRSRVLEALGRYHEAIEAANRALAIGSDAGVRVHVARLMALAGDRQGARKQLADAAARPLHEGPASLAYAYLALGDTNRALTLLERAEAQRDPSILWMGVDPRLDPVRSHPRFIALLRRLQLPASLDHLPSGP